VVNQQEEEGPHPGLNLCSNLIPWVNLCSNLIPWVNDRPHPVG